METSSSSCTNTLPAEELPTAMVIGGVSTAAVVSMKAASGVEVETHQEGATQCHQALPAEGWVVQKQDPGVLPQGTPFGDHPSDGPPSETKEEDPPEDQVAEEAGPSHFFLPPSKKNMRRSNSSLFVRGRELGGATDGDRRRGARQRKSKTGPWGRRPRGAIPRRKSRSR